jgi:hypothetical protein
MAELTEKEIQKLNQEIERQGLTYTELQQELLDHLCCDVEAEMDEGLEFIKALEKVQKGMGKDRIRQVQEETLLLINQKYRIMKKFMYVLGVIAPSLLIIGTIFKIQHWPGAGIMLVLSLFMLGAIYLPVFVMVKIRDTRKKGKKVNMPMYIFGLIAGIIFIAGAMFKIQHWPGAGMMISLSGIVTVLVFIPILVIQAVRDKENQVQNFTILIFVLSFVAITFMMYALRVSKNVLDAFAITAESHVETTGIMEDRNAAILGQFDMSIPGLEEKAANVEAITEQADALDQYIQDIMVRLVLLAHENNTEAVSEDGSIDMFRISNKDVLGSVEVVMFGDEGVPGKGKDLRLKIDEYRNLLLETADPLLANQIGRLLNTSPRDDYYPTWEDFNFRSVPMMSVLTLLTNIQSNVRFVQGEVLNQMLRQE